MNFTSKTSCILCGHEETHDFCVVSHRRYFHCGHCDLVFLNPDQRPSPEQEHAEYEQHNNDPEDLRYRRHLSKLTRPLVQDLPRHASGLDFGCGPGPTVSVMLEEQGFLVKNYDPYFVPDEAPLNCTYDFIACTEVAEHFFDPSTTFKLLASLLKPGGRLGLMTQFRPQDLAFADWYYIKERSHVTFYSEGSFSWLAQSLGWTIREMYSPIVIFVN